jgi:hydrogenase nickel incorporation protein HypB
MMSTRIVEVRQNILKKNDVLANELRTRFRASNLFVVSLVSSPGSGKTSFLESTLATLAPRLRVAALVGDLQTDNDARRLASTGVAVRQITTGTVCHLDAAMVADAVAGWDLDDLDVVFVENVGNLVCPASYDLGEALRVVLISVTEGEDKPLKYPTIFNSSDLAVITKIDLADAVGFDRQAALAAIDAVRPGMAVLEVSARRGSGMQVWIDLLDARRAAFAVRDAAASGGTVERDARSSVTAESRGRRAGSVP